MKGCTGEDKIKPKIVRDEVQKQKKEWKQKQQTVDELQ